MMKKTSSNLVECLRQIFTPQDWKSLHRRCKDFEQYRQCWTLPPLLYVALTVALEDGRSIGERFSIASGFYAKLRSKRKRCGTTLAGFTLAMGDLPLEVFSEVRKIIQKSVLTAVDPAKVGRWKAYGLDGTMQNLPRTDANERGFGAISKEPAMPQGLTVAAVALGTRVPWDWECGGARDYERNLAQKVIQRLPRGTLSVLDAGFVGFEFARNVLASGHHLLMRVGANVKLWVTKIGDAEIRGGEVWLWPQDYHDEPPLRLRLIKIVCRKKVQVKTGGKHGKRRKTKTIQTTMWLLTDVLDPKALTQDEAEDLFGRRWGSSEIRFRDWKCTMACTTLMSHTPEHAMREREVSLCAVMLLHVLSLRAQKTRAKTFRAVSVANAAITWRRAVFMLQKGSTTRWFAARMSKAVVDSYVRTRPKVKRRWPKRKDHNMASRPKLRKLTKGFKAIGLKRLQEASECIF